MNERESAPRLLAVLNDVDERLAGLALDDELFAELDTGDVHAAHGVAGRVQDRVISVLTRLSLEMSVREN